MAEKITPRLIELTYEATLKSYWRKSALRKFLRASYISESFLSSWDETESKRELLDSMFVALQKTEKGNNLILQMAKNLSEQNTFPDLRNWEDSDQKIQSASRAIQELKFYLREQNAKIKCEEDRINAKKLAQKERDDIQRTLIDKTRLQQELDLMHTKIGTPERW